LNGITPGTKSDTFAIFVIVLLLVLGRRVKNKEPDAEYHLNPTKVKEIADFIEPFRKMWDNRFNKLESVMDGNQSIET